MRLDEVSNFNLGAARTNFRKLLLDLSQATSEPFKPGPPVSDGEGDAPKISQTSFLSKHDDDIIEVFPTIKAPNIYSARLRIYIHRRIRPGINVPVTNHPVVKLAFKNHRNVEWINSAKSKRWERESVMTEYDVEI